jgi:outer membrane protein
MCIATFVPRRPLGKVGAGTRARIARRALAALAAFVLFPLATGAFAQQVPAPPPARVGYVDMQRLIDSSPQFITGREALQREFAERDAALKADEAKLVRLEAELKRDGPVLPPADAEARQQQVDALRRSIERTRTKLRDELNTRLREMVDERWNDIHDVVVEYAREHRIDLVVPSPVVYASASIDITDAVLERLKRVPADAAAAR